MVDARTESLQSLRELGPPDLVYLVKSNTKTAASKVGEPRKSGCEHRCRLTTGSGWHLSPCHRSGRILLSESRSLHKHSHPRNFRSTSEVSVRPILVIYCALASADMADRPSSCYNAFSRVDMRVQVQIPGTVESYCVDEHGKKLEATEENWLETYLCSVLRAYSYADNGSGDTIKKIVGVRRFNPITSTEQEHRFLDAAEKLFFNGW